MCPSRPDSWGRSWRLRFTSEIQSPPWLRSSGRDAQALLRPYKPVLLRTTKAKATAPRETDVALANRGTLHSKQPRGGSRHTWRGLGMLRSRGQQCRKHPQPWLSLVVAVQPGPLPCHAGEKQKAFTCHTLAQVSGVANPWLCRVEAASCMKGLCRGHVVSQGKFAVYTLHKGARGQGCCSLPPHPAGSRHPLHSQLRGHPSCSPKGSCVLQATGNNGFTPVLPGGCALAWTESQAPGTAAPETTGEILPIHAPLGEGSCCPPSSTAPS